MRLLSFFDTDKSYNVNKTVLFLDDKVLRNSRSPSVSDDDSWTEKGGTRALILNTINSNNISHYEKMFTDEIALTVFPPCYKKTGERYPRWELFLTRSVESLTLFVCTIIHIGAACPMYTIKSIQEIFTMNKSLLSTR